MTDNGAHQGMVLEAGELPFQVLEDPLAKSATKDALYIALDKITDPMNLGSIIRTAAFFDISGNIILWYPTNFLGIIVETQECAPLNPLVSKASSGALEVYTNIFKTTNLFHFLKETKKNGYSILG
jgi:21S rRNA (GM2251-2'-O)-methyltransferase